MRLTEQQRKRLKEAMKNIKVADYGNENQLREQIEHELRLDNPNAFHNERSLKARVFYNEPKDILVPRAYSIKPYVAKE